MRIVALAGIAGIVAAYVGYRGQPTAHETAAAGHQMAVANAASAHPADSRSERIAAMAAIRARLGPVATTGTLREALEKCAATDPKLALELAAAWARNRDEHYRLAWAIVSRWASFAPRDAWIWAQANAQAIAMPDEPSLLVACFQAAAASTEPQRVLAWIVTGLDASQPISARAALVDAGVAALVGAGRVNLARVAIERCESADPKAVSATALTNVAFAVLHSESPEAAAAWLDQLVDAPARSVARGALAGEWAERQPERALDWARTLPAGSNRESALSHALGAWAGHDSTAAANWFLQHEQTADADRLIPALIEQSRMAYTNPVAAIGWADLVRDPSLRSNSFAAVLQQWAEQDRAAAVRFIQESTLFTSQQRTTLLAAIGG